MATSSWGRIVVILLTAVVSLALARPGPLHTEDDPASSWLAYTVAKGNGQIVTYVNATWVVPSYPKDRVVGSAPGWWFGIEPEPADELIQPILAWGYTGTEFSIFNGYFQWSDGYWWSSKTGTVTPGQTVQASVEYDQSSNSYNMEIGCVETGWSVKSNIPVAQHQTYTDVYFVTEHQPDNCNEYPANGEVIFYDINIAWANQFQTPQWEAYQYRPACNSTAVVLSPSSVKFTWDT